MIIRDDPYNSNQRRHVRQDLIIFRGIQSRNINANFANEIAQAEAARKTLQGMTLKEYMLTVTGLSSLFR